jgi:Domain of unknown function (DUF397)
MGTHMSQISESLEVLFVDGADVPVQHKHAERMIALRDGSPDGAALYYTPDEWQAFILGVKDGEFDDMGAVPDVPPGGEPVIAIRDSKDPDGPKLYTPVNVWRELLDRIKAGERELPADMHGLLDERFR